MDKVKTLSKSPFKSDDKYKKQYDAISNLIEKAKKTDDPNKTFVLDLQKILNNCKDAVECWIISNVLQDLKYSKLAIHFKTKAAELGYNINESFDVESDSYSKLDLENAYEAGKLERYDSFDSYFDQTFVSGPTDATLNDIVDDSLTESVVVDLETEQKQKLDQIIGKKIQIEKSGIITTTEPIDSYTIDHKDIVVNFDNQQKTIPFDKLSKFINGDQIVMKDQDNKYFGLTLESVSQDLEMEIAEDLYQKYLSNPDLFHSVEDLQSLINSDKIDTEKVMSYLVGMGVDFETVDVDDLYDDQDSEIEPYLKESKNPYWNIFKNNQSVSDKTEFNPHAVKNLISDDVFLKFSLDQISTGDLDQDLKKMYNLYIKNDPQMIDKLKTYESYSETILEKSNSSNVYGNIINDMVYAYDVTPLTDKNKSIYEYVVNKLINPIDQLIEQNNETFKLYTSEVRSELISAFDNLSIEDIIQKFHDSDFTLEQLQDPDHKFSIDQLFDISSGSANFIINIILGLYTNLELFLQLEQTTATVIYMTIIAIIIKKSIGLTIE